MLSRAVALTFTALVLAAAAAFPAGAGAVVFPSVAVNESAGNVAASTSAVGIGVGFGSSPGDSVKNVQIILPPGLLINEETDSGACLRATATSTACQIGSGTATIGGASTPLSLFLVEAPTSSDLAGVELVAGPLALSGVLTFYSTANVGIEPSFGVSEELTFNDLPTSPALSALNATLTGLTLPSSCQPATVTVRAASQKLPLTMSATAPFTVTGCLALLFQPTLTSVVSRDTGNTGANAGFTLVIPTGDSTLESMKIRFPANLQLNPAMDSCFGGVPCAVGTVTASSPLFPASQLTGSVTLGGTVRGPALGISFPPPASIQLHTNFSSAGVAIYAMPDIPISSLKLNITGNSFGAVFVGLCYKALYSARLNPWSGAVTTIQSGQAQMGNCRTRKSRARVTGPRASASLSGVASGAVNLSIETTKGHGAPDIASLAISLPKGLGFNRTTPLTRRVLSLAGARLASARLEGRELVVRFKGATARSALALRAPLLVASQALRQGAGSLARGVSRLVVSVTDSRLHETKLLVTLSVS